MEGESAHGSILGAGHEEVVLADPRSEVEPHWPGRRREGTYSRHQGGEGISRIVDVGGLAVRARLEDADRAVAAGRDELAAIGSVG